MKHLRTAILAAVSLVVAGRVATAQAPARAPAADTAALGWARRLLVANRRVAPQLIDSLAAIYAASITLADLKELVRFYESPVGQRYGTAEVALSLQFAAIAKVWGMRVAIDVMKDLLDKGLISDLPPDDRRL